MTGEEKRAHLLKVYLAEGLQAAKPLAVEYGFCPSNLDLYARKSGHLQKPVIRELRQTRQKMWERARANGALVR